MEIQPTSLPDSLTHDATGFRGSQAEFLRLFLAQLQHQDPLDPKTGADMVAQLAQFSAVEQAVETNHRLAELATAQAGSMSAGLADLVDRTCTADADTFTVDERGGTPPALELHASQPIRGAEVIVRDAAGAEVRRIGVPDGGTTETVAWDGRGANGAPLAAGTYSIEIAAPPGAAIAATWRGRVDAVELTPDGPRLRMGGLLLQPAGVRTIGSRGSHPGDSV